MDVATAVGRTLVELGVDRVFGVVGSGNFHVINAMCDAGASFVAARHECGAATMADAYARLVRCVGALSVHQGCGLTNAMTGLTEAAKSRTPMVVIAAEATQPASNFHVDQAGLADAAGAVSMRVSSAVEAVPVAAAAFHTALQERRTVLLNLPLSVQAETADDAVIPSYPGCSTDGVSADVQALVAVLRAARRPVFVAGRGAA